MKDLVKKIDISSKDILPDLIQLRRHFHAHPELSGQEYQTAALVAGELRKSGWEVKEAVGRTGIVAEMGNQSGPVVGEANNFSSIKEGSNSPLAVRSASFWAAITNSLRPP